MAGRTREQVMAHLVGVAREASAAGKDGLSEIQDALSIAHNLPASQVMVSKHGHRGEPEDGGAHREYSLELGKFTADKSPMSLEAMIHAFRNPGGRFLRDMKL